MMAAIGSWSAWFWKTLDIHFIPDSFG